MKKSPRCMRSVASIASLALFVYMLERSGPAAVFHEMLVLGWGFAALLLLSGLGHILGSAAWSYCVQTRGQRPSWSKLFGPRLAGEALDDVTPAGPLLGEAVKVAVVSRLIPAEAGASSVVIENLVDALAGFLFILSGLLLALLKVARPHKLRWIGGEFAIGSLVAIALVGWIFTRRHLLVGRALNYLKRMKVARALIERHGDYLREVERAVLAFFLTHKGLFLGVLILEIASNFNGIAEIYLILKMTAGHPSFVAAYLLETANRAVQLTFSFVPFGVGIEEATAAATLQVLGHPGSEGVSLAVIRKLRSLFWVALGLLFAAKYSISRPSENDSRLRPWWRFI